ncbi:MAG TPA: hypothetical protein VK658_06770 [Chryseolinea sp.]|nr:hypothetical protein [Chryseolinea sp.]
MNPYTQKHQQIIGILTLLSGIIALGSMIVGLVATNYDFETFSSPEQLLDMAGATPVLIKWFMLLDMFGYYLLLLPVICYAHRRMETVTPWASLISASGFAYVIIGAIGAAALASAWPALMVNYRTAAADTKDIYKAAFLFSNDLVVKGIWNTLEVWLAGVWWLGLGMFTVNGRALKITTIVLAIACMLDGLGEAIGAPGLADFGLNIYLLFAIVWAMWIGFAMLRGKY